MADAAGDASQREATAESSSNMPPSPKRLKRSYVACRRCHAHKIKCSGDTPCRNCAQSRSAEECVYPLRDRKIYVQESYIKSLETELKTLRQHGGRAGASVSRETSGSVEPRRSQEYDDVSNPLTDGRARLLNDAALPQPVYIGEAACTSFVSGIRQHLNPGMPVSTIRRSTFPQDDWSHLQEPLAQLPDRIYAGLLIRVVSRFVGSDYHLMLRKRILQRLEESYAMNCWDDPVWMCTLYTIFALGELYSNRRTTGHMGEQFVPGSGFFTEALRFYQRVQEQASVPYIEMLLLMTLYSYALNRQSASYLYSGIALRLGLTLGLHRTIPEDQGLDPVDREHHIRVFWTVYIFDRLTSSKAGLPLTIRDEDIDIQMPSSKNLSPSELDEFAPPEHLIANIKLSKISGNIIGDLYRIPGGRRDSAFVQSVHKILTNLRSWDKTLVPELKLNPNVIPCYPARPIASLHLHFNQCIILTTRPVLFYVFKSRCKSAAELASQPNPPTISPMTTALAEACIHAARASNNLLAQLWVDGSIATYGYFDAHYIFSSTIILMLAALLRPNAADRDAVDTACSILQSMRDDGNIPARDFFEQLMLLKSSLDSLSTSSGKSPAGTTNDAEHVKRLLPSSKMAPTETSAVPLASTNEDIKPDFTTATTTAGQPSPSSQTSGTTPTAANGTAPTSSPTTTFSTTRIPASHPSHPSRRQPVQSQPHLAHAAQTATGLHPNPHIPLATGPGWLNMDETASSALDDMLIQDFLRQTAGGTDVTPMGGAVGANNAPAGAAGQGAAQAAASMGGLQPWTFEWDAGDYFAAAGMAQR